MKTKIYSFVLIAFLGLFTFSLNSAHATELEQGGKQVHCLSDKGGNYAPYYPLGYRLFSPAVKVVDQSLVVTLHAEFVDCAGFEKWRRVQKPHAYRLYLRNEQATLFSWYQSNTKLFVESSDLSYRASMKYSLNKLLNKKQRKLLARGASIPWTLKLHIEDSSIWSEAESLRLSRGYYHLNFDVKRYEGHWQLSKPVLTYFQQ